jgi:plastocyanin
MKPINLSLRVTGIGLCLLLGLAACTPPTPNAAAETPFVPPNTAATNAVAAPTTTALPEGYPVIPTSAPLPQDYPAETIVPPPTTAPESYPGVTTPPPATAAPAATSTSAPVFITYRDFEIVPAQTTVKAGTLVTFLIQGGEGSLHQPYAGASAPFIFEAPPNMGNGVSWGYVFNTAQTLTLLCGYHSNMTATLIVEP